MESPQKLVIVVVFAVRWFSIFTISSIVITGILLPGRAVTIYISRDLFYSMGYNILL